MHPVSKKDTAKQMSNRLGVSHMALDVKEIGESYSSLTNLRNKLR